MTKNPTIYQAKNGAIELKTDSNAETIWATQKQISQIFEVTPQNITIHLKQIFSDGELIEKSTCKESLQVQKEGNRQVKRQVKEYNLDAIIAVGYRINSILGTRFRIWATKTLKQHITQGYTINKNRIEQNYQAFMRAVEDVKSLAKNKVDNDDVLELIQSFANTWFSLEAFDEDELPQEGLNKSQIEIKAESLYLVVGRFKNDLMIKKQATQLFA